MCWRHSGFPEKIKEKEEKSTAHCKSWDEEVGSEFYSTVYRIRPRSFPRFISHCCPPQPLLQLHCSLAALLLKASPLPRTSPASFLSLLPISFIIPLRSHSICTLWILLAKHLTVLLAPEGQKLHLTILSPNSSCPSLVSGIKEEKARTPAEMRHLSMNAPLAPFIELTCTSIWVPYGFKPH